MSLFAWGENWFVKGTFEADNLGEFYRFINNHISNKNSIGAIHGDCGDVLTENMNKAN